MIAYKLFRLRKDGSLGPLFINRKQRIPINTWLPAEEHKTIGYQFRPGWHVAIRPFAPHLSTKGRVWMKVEVYDAVSLKRPLAQGGVWMLAKWMRVKGVYNENCS